MSEMSSSNESESDCQKPKKLSLRKSKPTDRMEGFVNPNDETPLSSDAFSNEKIGSENEVDVPESMNVMPSKPKLSLKKRPPSELESGKDLELVDNDSGKGQEDVSPEELVEENSLEVEVENDIEGMESLDVVEAIDSALGPTDEENSSSNEDDLKEVEARASPSLHPSEMAGESINQPEISMEEFRRAHHKGNEKTEISILPTVLGMGLVMGLIFLAGGLLIYKALTSEDQEVDALAEVVEAAVPAESDPVMITAEGREVDPVSPESSGDLREAVAEDEFMPQDVSNHANEEDVLRLKTESRIEKDIQHLNSFEKGLEDGSNRDMGEDDPSGEDVWDHDSAEIISEPIVDSVESRPSTEIQAFVANLTVNMVKTDALNQVQVVIDRVAYRPGDLINQELQLVLNRVDLESRRLIFTDSQGWEYLLLY